MTEISANTADLKGSVALTTAVTGLQCDNP